jgi:DNA-binding MarR family transcriptional regulator
MAETTASEADCVVALADALRPALLRLSRRLRTEGLKSEMTAQDTVVLSLIKAHPGIGVSGLAEREQTSRPTMSEHVKRLEARGFVARGADAEDGRRSGLALTPAGRRKLDQIRAERNNWLAKRLARLEPGERTQIAAAAAALARLASVDG